MSDVIYGGLLGHLGPLCCGLPWPTDSDSSLVSNENFSETLRPSGWALGQAT